MESLGLYLLKSAVWLTGFTLVFLMVLRNERYFRLNRIYLLLGIVASIVFPFYTWHYAVILPSVQVAYTTTSSVSAVAMALPPTPIPIYWWFYLVGLVCLVIRLIWQTGMVVRKLRKTGYVKTGSVKLVRTAEYAASFSFFSFVFVNPSTSDIETKEIVNHEREHILQKHWFDLLLVELLCMLQWFNPFIWIYARLIRQNHEYLADEMALQHTSNPAIYQATLLNQMLGAPVISLANSFSYSLNKKRFKMMKKKIDSPFRKLRILLVLPLVAMVFYAFAKPEYVSSTTAFPNNDVNINVDGSDVKGKVVKADGKPLHGTSVIVSGTTIGTIADIDGNFKLNSVPKDAKIAFSFVGFKTVMQKADFDQPMTIKMVTDTVKFEKGVVAVGYGTPAPPPPPSAFDLKNPPICIVDGVQVDAEKGKAIKFEDIETHTSLEGKAATDKYGEKGKYGVLEITLKKHHSVQPVAGVDIKSIDWKNPPLVLLDGLTIEKAEMDAINPNDIVSIDVLKDKSAISKYGEQAKNGIIQIKSNHPPLYMLDGVIIDPANMTIKSEDIESINVLRGKSGTEVYGEKGKNGVVMITSKKKVTVDSDKKVENIAVANAANQEKDKPVFVVVEEMPEFPGGENACQSFIAKTLRYPAEAIKNGLVGKVLVTFLVNKDGKIEYAKVVLGADPILNNEAVRVVSSMPDWKPGKQRGKAVDVVYTMPIEFKLQ
jgi:TonB family protein